MNSGISVVDAHLFAVPSVRHALVAVWLSFVTHTLSFFFFSKKVSFVLALFVKWNGRDSSPSVNVMYVNYFRVANNKEGVPKISFVVDQRFPSF